MLLLEHFHKLTLDLQNIDRLKSLILQLAVQGRLTAEWRRRNRLVESAEELLDSLKVEKQRLVKVGKLKAEKALPAVANDEIPFSLPEGWTWTRLGEICTKIGSGSTPRGGKDAYKLKGIKFIRSQNVHNEGLRFDNVAYIDEGTHRKMAGTKVFPNDLLLNITGGSIGRCALVPQDFDEANVSQHVTIIRTVPLLEVEYIHQLFMSPFFQNYIMATQTGGNREGLAKKNMELMLIPIAPLSEQKEIIELVKRSFEKVCQLQELAKEREILKEQFVGSALNKLTANTRVGWPIVKENFRNFFNDERSITKLKESILQLAVQGKLTPQVETDEPASDLLKRIKAEKAKLVNEGKLKKEKGLQPIREEEIPYEVPKGWVWCRLGEICHLITDGTHHTPKYVDTGIPFISVKDISKGVIDFSETRFISLKEHSELTKRCNPEFGDILLTKVGTTGIAKVVDVKTPFSIFVSVALLKFNQKLLFNYYLEYLINSPFVKKQSKEGTEGIGNKNLVLRKIHNFLIPLPPLAEQKRIIVKVKELLQQMDAIEQQIFKSKVQSQQLLQAVLREAFEKEPSTYNVEEKI